MRVAAGAGEDVDGALTLRRRRGGGTAAGEEEQRPVPGRAVAGGGCGGGGWLKTKGLRKRGDSSPCGPDR